LNCKPTNNGLNREQKGVLSEVLSELAALEFLNPDRRELFDYDFLLVVCGLGGGYLCEIGRCASFDQL